MAPPIFQLINILFDPDVSKKLVLQMAYGQIKAIGVAKVISALLGSGVVAVSSVIKIPQIKKILDPVSLDGKIRVAKGLSLESLSLEAVSQLIHIVYNRQSNTPFINYGESLLVGVQNLVILLLVDYYRKRETYLNSKTLSEDEQIRKSLEDLKVPVAIILAASVFLTKVAPSQLVELLQVLNIPISVVSKIPQIQNNYKLQSTNHLSRVTVFANVLGSAIRVFTTVKSKLKLKSNDFVLLAGYASGFILNSIVAGQMIYYNRIKAEEKEEKAE